MAALWSCPSPVGRPLTKELSTFFLAVAATDDDGSVTIITSIVASSVSPYESLSQGQFFIHSKKIRERMLVLAT